MSAFKNVVLAQVNIEQYGKNLSMFEKDLLKALNSHILNLKSILDRGITFTENTDCVIITYTTNATKDTEDTIALTGTLDNRKLNKIPIGFIPIAQNKAGSLYGTAALGTAWTNQNIYLKCSVASVTFTIMVF